VVGRSVVGALAGGSSRVEVRVTVKDSCEMAVPSTVLWRSLTCPEGLRHVVRACVALDHHVIPGPGAGRTVRDRGRCRAIEIASGHDHARADDQQIGASRAGLVPVLSKWIVLSFQLEFRPGQRWCCCDECTGGWHPLLRWRLVQWRAHHEDPRPLRRQPCRAGAHEEKKQQET
jgi:hypothetical protein